MIFRIATLHDIPRLAVARWAFRAESGELPSETELTFRARYEEFVREALRSGRWTYWIAETDTAELASHMAVCLVESIPRPARQGDQWGYLTDCYTQPSFRSQGVGGALMARVVEWAVMRDLELLLTWPSEAAAPFYARAGFKVDEEIRVLRLRQFDGPEPVKFESS